MFRAQGVTVATTDGMRRMMLEVESGSRLFRAVIFKGSLAAKEPGTERPTTSLSVLFMSANMFFTARLS